MLPIPAPLIDSTRASGVFATNNKNKKKIISINTKEKENHPDQSQSAYSFYFYYLHHPQQSRYFLPLIYLGATASLCYLFLFALVVSNNSNFPTTTINASSPSPLHHHHQTHRSLNNLQFDERAQSLQPLSASETFKGVATSGSFSAKEAVAQKRSEFEFAEEIEIEGKNRKQEKNQLLVSSSSSSTTTLWPPYPQLHRKTLHSLKKRKRSSKASSQNGSRRSDSPKIWAGHQDLIDNLEKFLRASPSLNKKAHLRLQLKRHGERQSSGAPEVFKYPWINDEDRQCNQLKIQFAKKNTFKPRALVSFPGSGNSWLRYLIECASGYFTGSVYNDSKLFDGGLLGELRPPNDGTTIVQKTHHDTVGNGKVYLKLSQLMFGYRGILLIRNPFDALIAYWNFLNHHGKDKHTGLARRSEFDGIRWVHFVTAKIPLWTSLIMSWVENSQDYLIVFFEDMQKNPRSEVRRILEYLGEPMNTTRLDCLMKGKNWEGPFHRSPSSEKLTPDPGPSSTLWQQDSTHHRDYDHHHETLLLRDSKKSQQQPQPQPQPPHTQSTPLSLRKSSSSARPSSFPIPTSSFSQERRRSEERGMKKEEQKEDKFLSSPQTISSLPHHEDPLEDHYFSSGNDNRHPNNSSILRLDLILIIQDNIDKINRFFQQKGIPVEKLHYFPRPGTKSYFLHSPHFTTDNAATIPL